MNKETPLVATRAALYLRVSTARQAEHDVSIFTCDGGRCSDRSIPMPQLDAIGCDHIENRLLQPERLEEILASILDRREDRADRRADPARKLRPDGRHPGRSAHVRQRRA